MAYRLNDKQETLKGKVSYYTYIWRTEPGACEACQALDGTEYTSTDEIPDKVHPNCKCYIDVVEDYEDSIGENDINEDDIKENDDEENNGNQNYNPDYSGDSDETRKECYDLTDEMIGNCDSLTDEVQAAINEFNTIVSNEKSENIKDKIEENIENLTYFLNELIDISFLLKDLYFNIQEIELQEIKRQLDNINDKINSIKNTVNKIYNNAKSEIEDFIHSKRKIEEKIEEFKTKSKIKDIKNFENKVKKWENKINYSRTPIFGKIGLSIFGGPDSAGMLNIAENKKIPIYTKDAVELNNVNDITTMHSSLSRFKPYMEDKIKEQFKDFNYYNINNIKGYVFKNNSAVVKRIKQSNEFKNIINSNIDKILKGERFSGEFKNDSNLHNAFGIVDFLNSGIDKQGNLHLYMFDTYDFNKNESPKIEAGRRQMMKGNLKPFFTIHDIIIPKEDYGKYGVEG